MSFCKQFFNFTMQIWVAVRWHCLAYVCDTMWKSIFIGIVWKVIKNQQLINLRSGGACSWTWSCSHVSQNKLSRCTLSCDISLYLAIKRNNFTRMWRNQVFFHFLLLLLIHKLIPNGMNKHRKSEGTTKYFWFV